MLKVHGAGDLTSENLAAKRLGQIACDSMPEIERSNDIVLEIIPSVQCFGEKIQDIDILVFFADYRNNNLYRAENGKQIHSFCAAIELKSHSPNNIIFEGEKCFVKYKGQLHDVTSQSEKQKYSVKNYIEKKSRRGSSPWITNLIWLIELSNSRIPHSSGNILSGEASWHEILNTIGNVSRRDNSDQITSFSSRGYLSDILLIFSKRLEASSNDRKKLETITNSVIDRSQQQYAGKLGEQLLIFRGRGGTGKTVRLIRIAYQIYNEFGKRVLLLTYNKALVADILRLLTLLKVKNAVGEGGIAIKTIHSFMHNWLVALGVIENLGSRFLDKYEEHKETILDYIKTETITQLDIENARIKASKELAWDLVMIDESQDWPATERDLIYKLYGYDKVVIADGIDQLVRGVEHIDWRHGIDNSKSQIVPLRKSLRLKSSLCKAVGHFAEKIDFPNWNLEPLPESHGGRVIVIFGDSMSKKFHKRLTATLLKDNNKPIDMLLCVPPSWVESDGSGGRQSRVARQYGDWGLEVWDGVDPEQREEYPTSLEQYRIVQYDSCRGLEGWIVVNFALDEFFEHKKKTAEFSNIEKSDIFFDEQASALEYAKRWIMIPLTRAIDTLVIHVTDPNSYVGECLGELHKNFPEILELHEF